VNHFGPRLRRVGFEPTASEIEALTREILAELDPQPAKPAAASHRVETRPAPAATRPETSADEAAALALIVEWKKGDRSLLQRYPTFGDFLAARGSAANASEGVARPLRERARDAWNDSPGQANDSALLGEKISDEAVELVAVVSPDRRSPGVVALSEDEIAEIQRQARDGNSGGASG
jgi:hypothetical protein